MGNIIAKSPTPVHVRRGAILEGGRIGAKFRRFVVDVASPKGERGL